MIVKSHYLMKTTSIVCGTPLKEKSFCGCRGSSAISFYLLWSLSVIKFLFHFNIEDTVVNLLRDRTDGVEIKSTGAANWRFLSCLPEIVLGLHKCQGSLSVPKILYLKKWERTSRRAGTKIPVLSA